MAEFWLKLKAYKDQTQAAANNLTTACKCNYYKDDQNHSFDRSELVDTVDQAMNSLTNSISKKLDNPQKTTDYYDFKARSIHDRLLDINQNHPQRQEVIRYAAFRMFLFFY